jgi:hypothetical protein
MISDKGTDIMNTSLLLSLPCEAQKNECW